VRHTAGEEHAWTSLQPRPQGAVADEREAPSAQAGEGVGEADHVLPRVERPREEVERRLTVPAGPPPGLGGVAAAEALEIDPAVDHLDPAGEPGDLGDELPAEVIRDGDHGVGAARHQARDGADTRDRPDVAHVLAVRRDDEPRAYGGRSEPRKRSGRDEEVRVDDVGPEAARRSEGVEGEAPVLRARAAAPIDDGTRDLVTLPLELRLHLAHEGAQVRIGRSGIHLRDEQDPH
jgi:hypothetical protein